MAKPYICNTTRAYETDEYVQNRSLITEKNTRSVVIIGTFCKAGEVQLWNKYIRLCRMPSVA